MGPLAIRRLRLASGLVLFTFVLTHLSNHALGLVSLDATEVGRGWFLALWRNPLGAAALYAALLTHLSLGLFSLFRRRHLRMPAWEATQLLIGLAVPALLIPHVVGTRVAGSLFGAVDSYARVVLGLWVLNPAAGARQACLLVIAWVHGCIGIHFLLRLRPWYRRFALPFFALALLVPVLALLGFSQAGREVTRLASQPGWAQATLEAARAPGPGERARLLRIQDGLATGFWVLLACVLLARLARNGLMQRRPGVTVTYPGDRRVSAPTGLTLLEISRRARVAHASVCGGRGRCSTCRVRVLRGLDALPEASAAERRVLERVGAPPDVRLACQVRPRADLAVALVLRPSAAPALSGAPHDRGREREVAVLFADLRGFTRMAERKLPYDVVFFLNRYFETVGRAIADSGGVANQFTGDGVMALFGLERGPAEGAREALAAALAMVANLGALSREFASEIGGPLRLGIGIHVGPAVVGNMGYGDTVYLTAVGDTVHVASRLEQLTKDYECELVVSEEVVARAGIDASPFARHQLTVRNREAPLAVRVIPRVRDLPLGPTPARP